MDKYFGMFEPGNWWVYTNQDNTKKDSIYVTDFNQTLLGPSNISCTQFPREEFILQASFLMNTSYPINGFYSSNETGDNFFSLTTPGSAFTITSNTMLFP
jgi:hypothetical protein